MSNRKLLIGSILYDQILRGCILCVQRILSVLVTD